MLVLPPIPTTDLTIEDVPDLMTKTRDLMVKTLREISVPSSTKDSDSEPLLSTRQSGNYDAISEEESDKSADDRAEVVDEEPTQRVTRSAKKDKKAGQGKKYAIA